MANRFIEKLLRFENLGPADITALEHASSGVRAYPAKFDLIREGDQPGAVFVILDGWACRYKILPNGSRQIMAFLMAGDTCDLHVGLLDEMDHSIQTVTRARVATIDRATMDSVIDGSRAIARAMYISQLVDQGILRAWIVSMGRRRSIERVAHLLCELFFRACSVDLTSEPPFVVPLSQLIVADALGMTPVHLNRMLKELRLDGAIGRLRGTIVVTDPLKLVQIAGFDNNYLHRRIGKKD